MPALALVPLAAAGCATALLFHQGSFGGDHGRHDLAIYLLGMPAILLLDHHPEFAFFGLTVLDVIWVPAVVNAALWQLPALAWRAVRALKGNSGPGQTSP